MKAARFLLEYLKENGVKYIFGIPAGSINAIFDELNDVPEITPIVTKHEGAAAYMAAAYAKFTNNLSVSIGSSGPGGTNLLSGAANAMREHLPILFITGSVPLNSIGLNAAQELDASPIFRPVTKYSVLVKDSKELIKEVKKACEIAISDVPGPVHIAIPLDIQNATIEDWKFPEPIKKTIIPPDPTAIKKVAQKLLLEENGIIFVGQGVRYSAPQVIELAELLNWPIITTPVAKGIIPETHPLVTGVFGFAGHEKTSSIINNGNGNVLLVIGSSLGETATNNYNPNLTKNRYTIQIDFDKTVFNRKYSIDLPVLGDIQLSLDLLLDELKKSGRTRTIYKLEHSKLENFDETTVEYNTMNTLQVLQKYLPISTRYAIDVGEFMSYVIHYMKALDFTSFDINVHFGAMGNGIATAIGSKLAEPERSTVCITGDGCFFMHGMEILTAKEYNLPILFVVINNARLGLVYHGHEMQFHRTHPSFEQQPVKISAIASAMDIPSYRVSSMQDLNNELMKQFKNLKGPVVLEIALVDHSLPPVGDRVKFLSSFGK